MKRFKQLLEMPLLYTSGIHKGRGGDELNLDSHAFNGGIHMSDFKNYHIKSTWHDTPNATIYAQHKKTGKIHMHVDLDNNHAVGLHAHHDSTIKAHEFYHHLITHHGIKLKSDTNQSPGAMKVWKKLKSYPDIKMTAHRGNKRVKMHRKFEDNYSTSNRDTYFKAVKK